MAVPVFRCTKCSNAVITIVVPKADQNGNHVWTVTHHGVTKDVTFPAQQADAAAGLTIHTLPASYP